MTRPSRAKVAGALGVRTMSRDVKSAWSLMLALVAFLAVLSMLKSHFAGPDTEQLASMAAPTLYLQATLE